MIGQPIGLQFVEVVWTEHVALMATSVYVLVVFHYRPHNKAASNSAQLISCERQRV